MSEVALHMGGMGGPGGGGALRISSDEDDQKIFLGFKFSIPGYFWGQKFGKYFFVYLSLSRDFFGYYQLPVF